MKPVPEVLDKMADLVLAYRPKSKAKRPRKRKAQKRGGEKRAKTPEIPGN